MDGQLKRGFLDVSVRAAIIDYPAFDTWISRMAFSCFAIVILLIRISMGSDHIILGIICSYGLLLVIVDSGKFCIFYR